MEDREHDNLVVVFSPPRRGSLRAVLGRRLQSAGVEITWPRRQPLNAKNLEALGAERLAELLIEISSGDAAAKQLLRMTLAAAKSPDELAKEISKRLATIARSRSFVDWQGVRALAGDWIRSAVPSRRWPQRTNCVL